MKKITIEEFIEQYDKADTIVLLEGKRNVLTKDKPKLTKLGKVLAERTKLIKFRSGNAEGADYHFSKGVAAVDSSRLQVITPYKGHREKFNLAGETFALDELNLEQESKLIETSKENSKHRNIVELYADGVRNRNSIKAAYLIRDTAKVLGAENIPPATFGIFYDDLDDEKSGGTGHTITVCEKNNIPVVNQSVWFEWLKQ